MSSTSPDSVLVLIPGSATGPEAVSLISKMTGLDPYQAKMKLIAKFPLPLSRVLHSEIESSLGDELEHVGIKFFAIDDKSLHSPFNHLRVKKCDFSAGRIQFEGLEKEHRDIPLESDVYIIELRYRQETRHKRTRKQHVPLAAGSPVESMMEVHRSSELNQVLHIYEHGNSIPIVMIDAEINYSSLGAGVEQNATWNFLRLKGTIEQVFELQADKRMIEYAFAAQQALTDTVVMRGQGAKKESNFFSNEESANMMSRLMYAAWLSEFKQPQKELR